MLIHYKIKKVVIEKSKKAIKGRPVKTVKKRKVS